jgi:hypothetical protein
MDRLSHKLPEISQNGSKPRNEENRCSPLEASRAAEILFGCYRTGGAAEPEIFVAGVAAVLSDYPAEIVQAVVDPRGGLPSRTQWLPTIAEVKTECERRMEPVRRQMERDRRLEESARLLAGPTEPKPTMEEIKAKLGDDYGLEGGLVRKRAEPSDDEIKAKLARMEAEASSLEIEVSDDLKALIAERASRVA